MSEPGTGGESFRLTAVDVRHYDFGRELRGYEKAKVESFREQVAEELERLARTSSDLESKARGFHEQLRAFRERDRALNEALVSAQQLRSEIREQAEREAQLILREARAEADRIVDSARGEIRKLEAQLETLHRSRMAFIAQVRSLVDRQLTELAAAESVVPPRAPETNGDARGAGAERTPAWLGSLVKE
jgi:cell division septum initiation protein DivIVA